MTDTTKSGWGKAAFTIQNGVDAPFQITVCGRDRWALECLIHAGESGCTPIRHPGPRWSGYVFNLRQLGVVIETITEPHDGPFPGTHARYVAAVQRHAVGQRRGGGMTAGADATALRPVPPLVRRLMQRHGLQSHTRAWWRPWPMGRARNDRPSGFLLCPMHSATKWPA